MDYCAPSWAKCIISGVRAEPQSQGGSSLDEHDRSSLATCKAWVKSVMDFSTEHFTAKDGGKEIHRHFDLQEVADGIGWDADAI